MDFKKYLLYNITGTINPTIVKKKEPEKAIITLNEGE